jgi:hypothetical protein
VAAHVVDGVLNEIYGSYGGGTLKIYQIWGGRWHHDSILA